MSNYILPVIRDGAIGSQQIGDGRIIPVLILDSTSCKDFETLVEIQEETGPGDVVVVWGYNPVNTRNVRLKIRFLKPMELEIIIPFDLKYQGPLVDTIINSRAVYLQSNKYGDSVVEGLQKPKIVIEVKPITKLNNWDKILIDNITKRFRDNGQSKKNAKKLAIDFIEKTRELFSNRM